MPTNIFQCPHCQGAMQAEAGFSGQVLCPHCQKALAIAPGGVSLGSTRPMPATVFGILNIIFGGFALLCSPVSLIGVFATQQLIQYAPPYKIWLMIGAVVGIFAGGWLLASGIGLLKIKKWALAGSYVYAWFAIVWGIVGTAMNAVALATDMVTMSREAMPGFIGGMIGGTVGLVYPILMLVFLRKPHVRNAFTP
jgi:hypothetical protein